ncbi:maleylpyruvate isomerase family mycothiol-dependent enzyme [Thalassiella azotivora]
MSDDPAHRFDDLDLSRDPADDAGYVRTLGLLADVSDRFMDTVKELDDEDVRAASLLPGWTRGHVLAHVARNADALGNLVHWARTGEPTPMYPSREARDADIEAGAARSASELESDLESAGERLLAAIAELPEDRRHVLVRAGSGHEAPAHEVLWWRVREVAYHHVDLATGTTTADLPRPVVDRGLVEAVERVTGGLALRLRATDTGWEAGPADGQVVTGSAADLLAWLTGRSQGTGLQSDRDLPELPSWG